MYRTNNYQPQGWVVDGDKGLLIFLKTRLIHPKPHPMTITVQPSCAGLDVHHVSHGLARLTRCNQIRQQGLWQNRPDRFQQYPYRPTTGQPDRKGVAITNAIFQNARLLHLQRFLSLNHDSPLDTATRH